MSKIFNIKGYYNEVFERNFNNHDMWEGKIFLNDDGWFEGIVVDPYSLYKEDRIVFGIYYPNKTIRLFKCTPVSVSDPFDFSCTYEDGAYQGFLDAITSYGLYLYGTAKITTAEVTKNIDQETLDLKNKIQRYKDNIMDATTGLFYHNAVALRSVLSKVILKNYEGKDWTREEIEEVKRTSAPYDERILESASKDIAKRVRTLNTPHYDDLDTDELPFN